MSEAAEEDTKAIVERVAVGKAPSVPASSSGFSKWGKVAGTVPAATPKAAPAVIRTIVKAPSREAVYAYFFVRTNDRQIDRQME